MKNYTLQLTKIHVYSTVIALLFFIMALIAAILSYYYETPHGGFSLIILLVISGFINWNRYLHKPIEIKVQNDTAIFKDILNRKTEEQLQDIIQIEYDKSKRLKIKTKQKEYIGINSFSKFEEFISDIKEVNPSLIVLCSKR